MSNRLLVPAKLSGIVHEEEQFPVQINFVANPAAALTAQFTWTSRSLRKIIKQRWNHVQ